MCVRKLICAILSVILLLGTVATAWAEDTATLTITPDKTEVTANGSAVQVKFTITVTPPEGRELGVFSFRELQGKRRSGHHLCGQRPAIRCDHRQGCVPDV